MMEQAERFRIFASILSLDDYEFVRQVDVAAARAFRKDRARIYRRELGSIARDAGRLYRLRASNIAEAGRWFAYPSLVLDTGLSYWAIVKLFTAGTLYSMELPRMVNTARNADRLLRFVTSQTIAASSASLSA